MLVAVAGAVAIAPAPTRAATAPDRVVRYGDAKLMVPATWPVFDLARRPSTCIRFDRHAVYLGTTTDTSTCPAHEVGRTEAVWLAPRGSDIQPVIGALRRVVGATDVVITYGADRTEADQIARSVTAARESAPLMSPTSWTKDSAMTTPSAAKLQQPPSAAGTVFVGNGFDSCAAPSEPLLNAWRAASPYRAVNVYIGGDNRACAQANLTPGWVADAMGSGWHLIPTYVGRQAPCYSSAARLMSSTTSAAARQGRDAADDASSQAGQLALPSGSPIYLDIEYYSRNNPTCSAAVMAFVQGWTTQLHADGWAAGAYGTEASLMADLSARVGTAYVQPDDIWIANWDGLDSVLGDAVVPDGSWPSHHRLHQYSGGTTQTYGGYSLNIDPDAVDARVAGGSSSACADYGSGTTGPDACTLPVAFTGPMQYWRFGAPSGTHSLQRWTKGSGGGEVNGATWAPGLSIPGSYDVSVWIPVKHANGLAHYTITDTVGAHDVDLDQSTHIGSWVDLGVFSTGANGTITLHVGDDTATSSTVSVDAARFSLVRPLDTQPPTGTIAAPGPGSYARPGATVTLGGNFEDDVAVTSVDFYVADATGTWQSAGTDGHRGSGRYAITWTESYPDGTPVSVRADVHDTGGHTTTVTAGGVLTVDGTAPSATMTAPQVRFTSSLSSPVAWTGSDQGAGIASWDVRWQRVGPTGWTSRWQPLLNAAPARRTTAIVPDTRPGSDYCLEVRAHDGAGNVSGWSNPRCEARALDDRALTASTGWMRTQRASGYLDRTFSQAWSYGRTLRLPAATATRIAVFATTCPTCGRVRVTLDGRLVAIVSLVATAWHRHQFLSTPVFDKLKGQLALTVSSGRRRVRIDGVAVISR